MLQRVDYTNVGYIKVEYINVGVTKVGYINVGVNELISVRPTSMLSDSVLGAGLTGSDRG